MFTGIVKEIGKIKSLTPNSSGVSLEVYSKSLLTEMEVDDSVSINGACQTVTALGSDYFRVQAVHTTLEKTGFGSLAIGDEVNLELALQLKTRLGGHLVQGHVNGLGKIKRLTKRGDNYEVWLTFPPQCAPYIVKEGSIAIDGISLTVADLNRAENMLMLAIIPHTWEQTALRNRTVESSVNIEVDIIAKYVENLLFYQANTNADPKKDLSVDWLREMGF